MGSSTTTVRVSPPKPPKKKRNASPDPIRDAERFFRRYRLLIFPYMSVTWLALAATLTVELGMPSVLLFGGCAALANAGIVWRGHRFGVRHRRVARALPPVLVKLWSRRVLVYAHAIPWCMALWASRATWGGSTPSLYSLAWLWVCTAIVAAPWWRHRMVRDSVIVTFHNLNRGQRDQRLRECKRLINDWTGFTSAARVTSAKLRGFEFTEYSVGIAVTLRRGVSAENITYRIRTAIGSAVPWPVAAGAVRVQFDPNDSQNAVFRLMIEDPHAQPFKAPVDEQPTMENIRIGLFETGAEVYFRLVNTLIAGETGSGKSGLINRLIQATAKIPTIALIGIDLTPGATELGPWRDVFHTVASTPDQVIKTFDDVLNEMERRGAIMSRNRWKLFRCTKQDPFMLVIVDEAQSVKQIKQHGMLATITEKIRKYGGAVVLASQHPTAPNLPTKITANCVQKIGLKVSTEAADRVIFGGHATRLGWSPSTMIPAGRKGSFLIKSEIYGQPVLARADFVEEADIDAEILKWAPHRTEVPSIVLQPLTATQVRTVDGLASGTTLTLELEESEVVDAEIMDSTEDHILDCLDRGIGTPTAIATELESFKIFVSVRTVNSKLRSLKERGAVIQPRVRGPWYRA
jgi:hypothetical protein